MEPHWVEEHDLESVDADDKGGFYDTIERSLLQGQPYPTKRNAGTAWDCAAFETLSFAVVAYDTDGKPTDCLATGHDPQGMIDGAFKRLVEPELDLSGCRVEKASK